MNRTSNFKDSVLHLSVNRYGVASLWDRESQATAVDGETYVRLELTKEQVDALWTARRQAKAKGRNA